MIIKDLCKSYYYVNNNNQSIYVMQIYFDDNKNSLGGLY